MDPLSFRVLMLAPRMYRIWAKIRLQHLQPWIRLWYLEGMYAGHAGVGAQHAWYATTITSTTVLLLAMLLIALIIIGSTLIIIASPCS